MRYLSLIILFAGLTSLDAQTVEPFSRDDQQKWARGTVYFADGKTSDADLLLLVSFNEGSLQLRKGNQVATYSPNLVNGFVYYDSLFEKYREFESVRTQFRRRTGSKKVFLEVLYQGEKYSLYRRYIPVVKLDAIIIPLPNYYIGWAIWAQGKIEPALFMHIKDDRAYQISKKVMTPISSDFDLLEASQVKRENRLGYDLENSTLKVLLGDSYKEMKKEVRKNRLDISHERGFIEGLKYLNGSSFQYNRKETPKKMRH